MKFKHLFLGLILTAFCGSAPVFAGGDGDFDAVSHTADGNYLDFSPAGLLELPRIFLVKDANGSYGLEFYGSTGNALISGNYAISEAETTKKAEHENHDTSTEALDPHHYLHADIVATHATLVVDFSPTRHLVFMIIAAILVCIVFISLANRYKKGVGRTSAPKGLFQNMFETLVLFVRDDVARPNLGKNADKYMPYLLSCFFLILFANLFGLIPFSGTATANITTTAVLAIFTFLITQKAGTKDYWMHIFWPPGIPIWMKPILIPIEILGIFTKPFALAVRLFANMTAGHLVILNFIGLIFLFNVKFGSVAAYGVAPLGVFMAFFINMIEIMVAFIQAYVFTMLSALFIGMAAEEHHHDEAHAH
ncbi:MAG: F0F1 ATP synthase subunit A [Bacteroidetes Order II. Incertae sedis bacterium]|nr:F0F1 ATP synthase subunit A [Bacteroidetes Order II. bacterium]